MFFDHNNLIVQVNGDGGDTAQRTGMYYFGLWVRENKLHLTNMHMPLSLKEDFERALTHLEKNPGEYVRHPDQWNGVNDFSRDQQTPIVLALGAYGMKDRLMRLFLKQVGRFGKYQNKDWASPEHWGFYIRALGLTEAYPILFIGDMFMLVNSALICFWWGRDKNFTDDNNHILALLQATLFMPTPVSRFAKWLYVKYRPENMGNSLVHEKNNIYTALLWYHSERHFGNPEMAWIYKPIIEKYFSNEAT